MIADSEALFRRVGTVSENICKTSSRLASESAPFTECGSSPITLSPLRPVSAEAAQAWRQPVLEFS